MGPASRRPRPAGGRGRRRRLAAGSGLGQRRRESGLDRAVPARSGRRSRSQGRRVHRLRGPAWPLRCPVRPARARRQRSGLSRRPLPPSRHRAWPRAGARLRPRPGRAVPAPRQIGRHRSRCRPYQSPAPPCRRSTEAPFAPRQRPRLRDQRRRHPCRERLGP